MSILQQGKGVWQRLREYTDLGDFPPETAPIVKQYAEAAYRDCVRWFGPPADAQRPYKVIQGERSFFCRSFGNPIITISKHAASKEQLCGDIAHEMYHRVTEGRTGFANELWIKEIMATLTSVWFLRNQGFKDYTDAAKANLLAGEGKADVSLLRNASHSLRQYIWSGAPAYPQGFAESVWRIGYALNRAVDFEHQPTLIKHSTLEGWIDSLPQEDQYAACRVLELPTEGKTKPHNDKEIGKLFYALQAKGDKEDLAAEFKQLADLQATNGYVFFYLGYAYHKAKRYDNALTAYAKAEELGYLDKWLLYNIGSVYWSAKNYALAAEWFGKAAAQTLDWAQPLYFLGRSLNNLGSTLEARQAWEKVLTLSDEHYTQLAAKALRENPLPDAV